MEAELPQEFLLTDARTDSGLTKAERRIEQARKSGRGELLDLHGLGLTILPESIRHLAGLRRLFLYNNELVEIPQCLADLCSLEGLSLQSNKLASIPEWLTKLARLQEL